MNPTCFYCNGPIEPGDKCDQATWGWERIAGVRSSGKHGGSDIYMRQPLDRFAHTNCVDLIRLGVTPQQLTIA